MLVRAWRLMTPAPVAMVWSASMRSVTWRPSRLIGNSCLPVCAGQMLAAYCMLIAQWLQEGIKSIAEGVENQAMFAFAQAINVALVQGWFVDILVRMSLTEGAK